MELTQRFRFDNFVVGAANRLAVAAARAVAEAPGSVYNPLFIYSQSGLGKSHLLEAIGNRALQLAPDLTVEYLSLDEFMDQLHAAVSGGEGESFKRRYQNVGLLLLDDVQFLTGRRETQAELLRLFNTLQGTGRQVVMASDRPPSEIADVDERLVSRLAGGLVVDIDAPDYETRVAILRQKLEERGAEFGPELVEELARAQVGNVRELQGALNRLLALRALEGVEITVEQVRGAVQRAGLTPTSARRVTPMPAPAVVDAPRPAAARPTPVGAAAAVPAPDVPDPAEMAKSLLDEPIKKGEDALMDYVGDDDPIYGGPPPTDRVVDTGEFTSFLADIAQTVERNVQSWKIRLGEQVAYWSGEGYRTSVLEKAMKLPSAPDVDGLLTHYAAAVEHLKALEAEAAQIDPALGAHEAFRDPERVAEAETVVKQALSEGAAPPGPSPAFARAAFEVGPSNQLAARAADAVAQEPGRRYNPLFLHGPSGVGKTHLANAIGNELVAQNPSWTVAAVGAPTFVDELITALQAGNVERWRARYRRADALVLDDVHFVAGKERTQDELFHVFNALHQAGKQIILASDRPPKELDGLEERLRSRFEGGLVVAIQAPDRQLRKRLFQRYFQQATIAADDELLNYLADRPATSVREIVGTVNRLAASAEVAGVAVTADFARAELEGAGAVPAPAPAAMSVADPFFLDDEKVVWEWPDVGGRIIEELR